jgi:hypothetical protein
LKLTIRLPHMEKLKLRLLPGWTGIHAGSLQRETLRANSGEIT